MCFDEVWKHDTYFRWSRTKLSRAFKARQRNLNLCRLSQAPRRDLKQALFHCGNCPAVPSEAE